MASAGQAQAHSSQPMHFSSPSGQRLSWWRPRKRGAVGSMTSGYSTVSTFLNIVRKVTPNPLTGLRKSNTRDLLGGAVGGGPRVAGATGGSPWLVPGASRDADPVVVRKIHGRDGGTPRGHRGGRAHHTADGGAVRLVRRLRCQPPPFRGHVAQEEQQDDARDDEPGHDIDGRAPAAGPPACAGPRRGPPPPSRAHAAQEEQQDDARNDEPAHDIAGRAPAVL